MPIRPHGHTHSAAHARVRCGATTAHAFARTRSIACAPQRPTQEWVQLRLIRVVAVLRFR
eukprot:1555381-Prymnesium_polylepis.1